MTENHGTMKVKNATLWSRDDVERKETERNYAQQREFPEEKAAGKKRATLKLKRYVIYYGLGL